MIEPDKASRSLFGWLFNSITLFVISLIATAVLWSLRTEGGFWVEVGFIVSTSVAIAILIGEACDPFADAAQWVGVQLRVPSSVRGATLDAIASSMPELFTGIFFVTVALTGSTDQAAQLAESAQGYGSTIATCAGSSIYNLVLIPAVCAIAVSFYRPSQPFVSIERDVVNRDGMWVIVAQFGLLYFLFQPALHWWMGVIALVAYAIYVSHLYLATQAYRRKLAAANIEVEEPDDEASLLFGCFDVKLTRVTATLILLGSTIVAAVACYLLVELTNLSAEKLGVSPFFVAVILTAAVSSIPDTFMSLGSAMRGDDSGAVSNVFGSNIFDICIGMSIPLMVCCYLNNWEPVLLVSEDGQTMAGVVGLRVLLFFLSVCALASMWYFRKITRKTACFFCGLYLIFVGYAVIGGMLERGILTWGQG